MENVALNNTYEKISEDHISWTVLEEGNTMILYEIVDAYYPHPQAPEDAFIIVTELNEKRRITREDEKAPLKLLKYALENIDLREAKHGNK